MNYEEEAESEFNLGHYREAFLIFSRLAEDISADPKSRSYSYQMMGTINGNFFNFDPDDETGVKYYQKAFEIDASDPALLLNIIYSFGNGRTFHHEVELFRKAHALLTTEHWDSLTAKEKLDVQRIFKERL